MYKKYDDMPERSHPDYQKLWARKHREKIRLNGKLKRASMTTEQKEKLYGRQKAYRTEYYKLEKNVIKRNEKQWNKRGILNLNWDIYKKTLLEQNNNCQICNETMTTPHADHNHKTGEFRALLCSGCNLSLGRYEKFKKQFENYIRRYNA
tara:strand:+ start:159 stop:608 length:450 start_codon:yes stop_codon:yes gene_type:complete